MPRAKRQSDETYNIRRRALRLAARLEKQGKTSEAQAIRIQAAKTKQSAYASRKEYAAHRVAATSQLIETRVKAEKQVTMSRQARVASQRRSSVFLNEMQAMREGKANAIVPTQQLSQQAAQLKGQLYENIFYRATRTVWYDSDNPQSAKYALENFMIAKGFENFQDAWEYVMNSQSDALAKVDELVAAMERGEIPAQNLYELFHNADGSTTDVYQDIAGLITDFM